MSHSRSLLPFENLEWRPARLLSCCFVGEDVFSSRSFLPVSNQFAGIVKKCSRILKYSDANPDCYPKILQFDFILIYSK